MTTTTAKHCHYFRTSESSDPLILEPDNSAASDAIVDKLTRVTHMAESLDTVLKEVGILCENAVQNFTSLCTLKQDDEEEEAIKSQSEESMVRCSSDQESAVTAPLWNPTSRSSSYHTASECRSSPWWDSEKNSDLEAEVIPGVQMHIRPVEMSSASTSFDGSDQSLMSTTNHSFECQKARNNEPLMDDDDTRGDDEGETSSSTISQQSSRKESLQPDEEAVDEIALDSPLPPAIIDTSKEVSGKASQHPDFMAWNRYYQSILNKQTLRSCL